MFKSWAKGVNVVKNKRRERAAKWLSMRMRGGICEGRKSRKVRKREGEERDEERKEESVVEER